jgi:hypothetical protein
MLDRIIIIGGFVWMTIGLMFIAHQTLRVVQIANDITLLILKTHP